METVYADELYEFLSEMVATAHSHGDEEVERRIDQARRQYKVPLTTGKYLAMPLTSEFLGESMAALRDVLEKAGHLFTSEQISRAQEYAESIKRQWFSPR